MTARIDGHHGGLPKPPVSLLLISIFLATSASFADSRAAAEPLVSHTAEEHSRCPDAESPTCRAQTPIVTSALSGNSLIALRAAVYKVSVTFPPSEEEPDDPTPPAIAPLDENAGRPSVQSAHGEYTADAGSVGAQASWSSKLGKFRLLSLSNIFVIRWFHLIGFIATGLLVYVMVDAVRSRRQQETLRSVRTKMCRLNEFFLGLHSDKALCLCCVEFMPTSSPSTVTFLCGHGFHTCCVNDSHKRHCSACEGEGAAGEESKCPGSCPVCTGQWGLSQPPAQPSKEDALDCEEVAGAALTIGGTSSDCDRLFALHSLCERYPGIITKDESHRLASHPTAVMLTEIQFARLEPKPHFGSIFG